MGKRQRSSAGEQEITWDEVQKAIRKLKPEVILAAARICDGHTIFNQKCFLDAGLPPAVVSFYTERQESDPSGHPKGQIFSNEGYHLASLRGIYGLRLIQGLCRALGVEYESKLGRGFQAQACMYALEQHFKENKVAE